MAAVAVTVEVTTTVTISVVVTVAVTISVAVTLAEAITITSSHDFLHAVQRLDAYRFDHRVPTDSKEK